jgi:sugar lactone lactonase YvrE
MDIQARDGALWVAENGRHRVTCYDRDGKRLSSFGKRDRKAVDGFGGCCEPKNIRFGPDGDVYCSESGAPTVVKRFTVDGEFRGVATLVHFKGGCVRATVEVSPDGKDVYVLDTATDTIHRFSRSDAAESVGG